MKHSVALMAVASALSIALSARAAEAPAACAPSAVFDASTFDHLDGYRVFLGPDGDSQVEPLHIAAKKVPLLKTGKILTLLDLIKAPQRNVGIVAGPPNVDLPMHAAPYREMFVLLSGDLTFKTAKFSAAMHPGSVLFFEDVGAKIGHGGHIGPCGYTSLSIAP